MENISLSFRHSPSYSMDIGLNRLFIAPSTVTVVTVSDLPLYICDDIFHCGVKTKKYIDIFKRSF